MFKVICDVSHTNNINPIEIFYFLKRIGSFCTCIEVKI